MNGIAELNELLLRLESARTEITGELETRYWEAVAAIEIPRTFEEFRNQIGLFGAFVAYGLQPDGGLSGHRDTMASIFRAFIRPQMTAQFGSEHTAFRIFRDELEGGRRDLLNSLFSLCVRWQLETQTRVPVRVFLGKLSLMEFEERIEVTATYFARYGHLLPVDVTSASPAMRAYLLEGLLEKHVSIMESLRDAGRGFVK